MSHSSGPEAGALELLGVRVEPWTPDRLLRRLAAAIRSRERLIVANHNAHSAALYHRTAEMREFFAQAGHVHFDGMPLVFWGRLLGYPVRRENRITYVDWLPDLLHAAVREGWGVFYLGSTPEVAARGAEVLRGRHPGLRLEARSGYFDATPGSAENDAVVDAVNRAAPDILMVGMGMPRQEIWILRNAQRLTVPVILPAGACLDYVAGALPTPPRWMGRIGLEWMFRLASEPRRLAHRYLVEPWILAPHAARDLARALRRKR
jgi:N-acetylglucosaminyldiphosphoundecaprenol N-acetyl-beta-D-mannosaminyltransferase